MEKFSKIQRNTIKKEPNDDVLFDNEYIKIIKYEDWSIIKERDLVVGIIYFIEENKFLLRHEYIPTFKYVEGDEYYVTILSGGVEEEEIPKDAFFREIEEEAGIFIDGKYDLTDFKPLFINKGHTNKYYPFILTLTNNSFTEKVPQGDGSESEKKSRCVILSIDQIDYIQTSDLITDYMLMKFKEYLNK